MRHRLTKDLLYFHTQLKAYNIKNEIYKWPTNSNALAANCTGISNNEPVMKIKEVDN